MCKHQWLPYENLAHYEEDKLHCTFLITKICSECGDVVEVKKTKSD